MDEFGSDVENGERNGCCEWDESEDKSQSAYLLTKLEEVLLKCEAEPEPESEGSCIV